MDISRIELKWTKADVINTRTYKDLDSSGAHYVNAHQIYEIVNEIAVKNSVFEFRDPEITEKIASKAEEIFNRLLDDVEEIKVASESQAIDIDNKLREGTDLSASEFKPVVLMWKIHEILKDIDSHEIANESLKIFFKENKDIINTTIKGGAKTGGIFSKWLGASVDASKTHEELKHEVDSGYFKNNEQFTQYKESFIDRTGEDVKIVGRGIKLLEKSKFNNRLDIVAGVISVMTFNRASAFKSDSFISSDMFASLKIWDAESIGVTLKKENQSEDLGLQLQRFVEKYKRVFVDFEIENPLELLKDHHNRDDYRVKIVMTETPRLGVISEADANAGMASGRMPNRIAIGRHSYLRITSMVIEENRNDPRGISKRSIGSSLFTTLSRANFSEISLSGCYIDSTESIVGIGNNTFAKITLADLHVNLSQSFANSREILLFKIDNGWFFHGSSAVVSCSHLDTYSDVNGVRKAYLGNNVSFQKDQGVFYINENTSATMKKAPLNYIEYLKQFGL
jgi:hypothetical protein